MKLAVHYPVDVSPEERKALASHLKHDGLATRNEIKEFFEQHGKINGFKKLRSYLKEHYLEEAKRLEKLAEDMK